MASKSKPKPAASAGATTETTDAATGANGQASNVETVSTEDEKKKAERKAKREAQEKAESAFTGAWKKLASITDNLVKRMVKDGTPLGEGEQASIYEAINAGDEALAALFPPEKSEAELKADRSEALARLTKGEITEDEFSTIAAKIGAKINRIRAAKKKADEEAAAAAEAKAKAAAEGQSEQASA